VRCYGDCSWGGSAALAAANCDKNLQFQGDYVYVVLNFLEQGRPKYIAVGPKCVAASNSIFKIFKLNKDFI